ncbi:MAG TPA: Minf_1886 family protein [Candidatus Udaeobacter sp.]|jgi:uncharacterized repeat protein (TIGR04138 family)|nr:Minf_1886 family protein [Candidatus Udaeobacter sp.]
MSRSDPTFWDVVETLRARDPRYRREAYGFVVAALGTTVQALPAVRRADPLRRHLTGGELVQGVVALARSEFGDLADVVFEEWGVRSAEDIGHIVFQLVECGQLSARAEDSLEDFRRGPDLMHALRSEDERSAPGAGRTRAEGGASAAE